MNTSIAVFWIAPAEASGPVRESVLPIRTGFWAWSDVATHSKAAATAARQMGCMRLLLVALIGWTPIRCQSRNASVYWPIANALSMVKETMAQRTMERTKK